MRVESRPREAKTFYAPRRHAGERYFAQRRELLARDAFLLAKRPEVALFVVVVVDVVVLPSHPTIESLSLFLCFSLLFPFLHLSLFLSGSLCLSYVRKISRIVTRWNDVAPVSRRFSHENTERVRGVLSPRRRNVRRNLR